MVVVGGLIDFSLANVFVIRMVVQSDSSANFVVFKVECECSSTQ